MEFRERVDDVIEIYQTGKSGERKFVCLATSRCQYPLTDNYGLIVLQDFLSGKSIEVSGERDYATTYEKKFNLMPEENRGIRAIPGSLTDADYFNHERDATYEVKVDGEAKCKTRLVVTKDTVSLITLRD